MKVTLTPEIIVALVQETIGVALAFGLDLTQAQSASLIGLVTIVAGALIGHSAANVSGAARIEAAKARPLPPTP